MESICVAYPNIAEALENVSRTFDARLENLGVHITQLCEVAVLGR